MADLRDRLQDALTGRYELVRELARGGNGVVFLAEDLKHERSVALKVLRPELTETLGAERFLREIRIAARLNHPNIVSLIDSGEAGGLLYYVMFHVEGESLRDRLDREGQLPVDEALRIAREVGEALSYAHDRGVIHRDVKPGNILFEAGHALVADFGIAKALRNAGGERLTETGLAIGTPSYMSPEQASGTETIDQRADVYGLACVLYEMLGGEVPFTGPTPQTILARKMMEKPPSLRVVRDTVPRAVESAINRALSPTAADRQAGVEEFLVDLTRESAETGAPTGGPPWRWNAAGPVGAALVLTAGVAAVVWTMAGGDGDPSPPASFGQLTSEPGVEAGPCLSPDGEWLVYAGDEGGDRDLFLRSIGGQNPLLLTPDSPADDIQPAFSRDGTRIAFRSDRGGGGIFVMGRTGEGVRRVTDGGFSPDWSPDGTSLVFSRENVGITPLNMERSSDLWIVEVDGGAPAPLGVTDGVDPSWSPHGHRIAYATRFPGEELGKAAGEAKLDIRTLPAGGGEETPVTDDPANDWSPAWSADGRHVYFVSDRGGSMNLWRVAVDEESGRVLGEPEPVTAPAQFVAHPCVSADGHHLVFSNIVTTTQNARKATFDPGTGEVGEEMWVTRGTRRWANPDPSPDGSRVTLYSQDRPEGDLYVVNADGTGLRQLTSDSAIDRVPRWSPDAGRILYFSTRSGPLDVWTIRPDGSDNRQITEGGAGVGAWSPDGSRIAATHIRGTALVDAAGPWTEETVEWLPPPDSALGRFAVNDWSPDGGLLAGSIDYRDTGIVIYTFENRSYEKVTDFGQWPVFLPDSRRVLFVSGGNRFFVHDLTTDETEEINATPWDVLGPPRLAADASEIFFTRRVTEGDVWLLTLREPSS